MKFKHKFKPYAIIIVGTNGTFRIVPTGISKYPIFSTSLKTRNSYQPVYGILAEHLPSLPVLIVFSLAAY